MLGFRRFYLQGMGIRLFHLISGFYCRTVRTFKTLNPEPLEHRTQVFKATHPAKPSQAEKAKKIEAEIVKKEEAPTTWALATLNP